jgi:hypothetical protein
MPYFRPKDTGPDFVDMLLQKKYSSMMQHEDLKDKLLNDPTYSDHVLARLSRSAMTDKAAAKMPEGASFEKAMSAIDQGDPRKSMLMQLQADMPSIIKSSPYGVNPSETIMKSVQERSGASKEEIYKYIQKNSGMFGKDVAPEAGYEEWAGKNPGMTGPGTAFAMGAGGQLASEGIQKFAGSRMMTALPAAARVLGMVGRGLSFAPPIPGIGMAAKLVGAGLMTIPAMLATDVVKKAAAGAGYEFGGSAPKQLLEELITGAPGFIGVNKLAGMGVAKGAAKLASLKEGLNIFGDKAVSSAATKGVSREDITALSTAMRTKAEAEAFSVAEHAAKIEKFSQPTMEDMIAIQANPEKRVEIIKARLQANLTEEVATTQANKEMLDKRIIERADQLRANDSTVSPEDAVIRSKRLLSPSQIETNADTAVMRQHGMSDERIAQFMPAERAQWADELNRTRGGQLVARENLDHMLPKPVPPESMPIRNTLKLQREASVIRAEAPERLGLPATGEAPLTRTIEQKLGEASGRLQTAAEGTGVVGKMTTSGSANESVLARLQARARGEKVPTTEAPKTFAQQAKELNIIYNGPQEWPHKPGTPKRPPIQYFTDKITGSTFGVEEGDDIVANLTDMRKKFGVVADVIKTSSVAPAAKVEPVVASFADRAARIVQTVDEELKASVASISKPRAHIDKINLVVVKAKDELTMLANRMDITKSKREFYDKAITELDRKFKDPTAGLEDAAKVMRDEETGVLASTNTPKGRDVARDMAANMDMLDDEARATLAAGKKAEWQQIFGKKGKVTAEDVNANKEKLQKWYDKWQPMKQFGIPAIAGAALIPVASMLSPEQAEAAPFKGTFVTSGVKSLIESSGKAVEEMTQKFIDAGFGSMKLSENGHTIERLMVGKSFAPASPDVFEKTRPMRFIDTLASYHTRQELHMRAQYADGTKAPYGIGTELGDRSQVIQNNISGTLKAVTSILKDNGITGDLQAVSDEMLPLVQKYHKQVNLENPYYQGRLAMLEQVLEGKYSSIADTKMRDLSKMLKIAGKDVSKLAPEDKAYYDLIMGEKQSMMDKIAGLKPDMDAFNTEIDTVYKSLAAKHSSSRVALAADGVGMTDADPWLRNMLAPNERIAVDEITAINRTYGVRMQETGHDVIAGPYMHHPAHPSVDYSADLKDLEKIASDGADAMRLVNFFHRQSGSKLMIPDVGYVMGKYVPDAAKRIEISDMWKMGKEGGWDFIRKQMQARGGYEGALKLIDDVRTAFDPIDVGGSAKWINRYAAFEVARLLTLSPSVSFKHALKLMGNWTIFPTEVSAKATGENMSLFNRRLAQDLAGESFKGKDNVVDLARAYTDQSHIYAAVSDMAPYELPTNIYDKFITKWNEGGSVLVNGVERWDRGQTFISAMMMSQKKGMTPDQARFALMDSVLKVNFLTGPNNPKWLKDPMVRTMLLFQGTPFKILEQRAMLAYQGGKDIKAAGVELLRQLRADVKIGEERFKFNLLKDELTKSKDVYGTAYSSQLLKQMMVLGTVVYTGKTVFDSDLWGHAFHVPGIKMGEKGAQLGFNPIVASTWQTLSGGNKKDDDEFWMSRFLGSWLTGGGTPAIVNKMLRLNNDDVPEIYKENKLNYLFGVPKTKDK